MFDKANSRMTPINDEYPTCDRTYSEIRIYIKNENSEYITNLLKMCPTDSQDQGDSILTSSGTHRIASKTYWCLSSENLVQSRDIRVHLDWLLPELAKAACGISVLQNQKDVHMFVCCVWWSRSGHGGPTLWPEQMKQLSDLNLECSFDIQFYGDAEE